MKTNKFAAFILSHGRPDNVITYKTIKAAGYSGPIYIIVDNEDKTIERYVKNFGPENVIVFDKKAMADSIDEANNFDNRKVIVHARNYCFIAARQLGLSHFIQLDDDYTNIHHRYESKDGKKLLMINVKNFDSILDIYINFLDATNFKSIAFAQGGDFIGGVNNPYVKHRPLMRKAMNTFICRTDRPFEFIGAINEDVNTYTTLGGRGDLFGTIPMINIVQKQTQSQNGGMTDVYQLSGTYVKSFHTVLMQPASVKVSMMHSKNIRLHHLINWNTTVPVIIDEKYKKR
jgi:hypothetical protein